MIREDEELRKFQERYAMERARLAWRLAQDLKTEAMLKDAIRPEMKEVKEEGAKLLK